jgi:hypothetical protein
MNTASNTHLRLTTQVRQDHAATGVLLALGTNNQFHGPENAVEHQLEPHWPTPVRLVSTTGQTGPCWWILWTSIERPLHRSDRFKPGNPKSTKQAYRDPNWPKLETTATQDNNELTQTFTRDKLNRSLHRSDWWEAPVRPVWPELSGWTAPVGQLPQIQLPISWIAPWICARLWG